MAMRILSLLVLLTGPLTAPAADREPGLLVAVDRAVLRLADLPADRFPVYHAARKVVFVRATEKDLRFLNHHHVFYAVLGPDAEHAAYWVVSGRDVPRIRSTVPSGVICYAADDVVIFSRMPGSGQTGEDPPVRVRQSAWDLGELRTLGRSISPTQGNDSLVAALCAMVNPDTVRWIIQSLQDFKTRYAVAATRDSVAVWIQRQFLRMGYADARFGPFLWNGLAQNNVIAELAGSNPGGETIIVGGHHDSNSFGDPMVAAPGADDNASGTAAVMEIARVLKTAGYQPELSIKFITFAAEEVGLVGSGVDAALARQEGTPVRLMVNHDMIAHTLAPPGARTVDLNYYAGAEAYREFAWQAVVDFTSLVPHVGTGNSSGSDSYSYWREGYPALYFEETQFSPYYHSEQDILEHVSVEYCAEVIRASCATVLRASFTPGTVRALSIRDRGDGSSLLAIWSGVQDLDLVGYRVHVTGSGRDSSIMTTDTMLVIDGLEAGVQLAIEVTAVDGDGNEGFSALGIGTPHLDPLPPNQFVARPGWHQVALWWAPNRELDFLGYRVFRADSGGFGGTELTSVAVRETVYVDTTAQVGSFYQYSIVAIDSTGHASAPSAGVRSRVVSLDQGVLLVDETADGNSPPSNAPDSLHDAFYARIVDAFQPAFYDAAMEGKIDLAAMGAYSTLVWYGDDLGDFAAASASREDLKAYLDYGGRLLYTGFRPSRTFSDGTGFTTEYAPGAFIYDYLHIRRKESPPLAPGMNVARAASGGIGDVRVDPTKTPPVINGHLRNVEAVFAAEDALELFTYDSELDTAGALKGKPVGVQSLGEPAWTVVLGFPLAYMVEDDARALVRHVLIDLFSEPTPVEDLPSQLPEAFALWQNYPNPFNPSTTVRYALPQEAMVTLTVYDLLGREVTVLYRSLTPAGNHAVVWDAAALASGVYFVRMEASPATRTGYFTATRKVVLLR